MMSTDGFRHVMETFQVDVSKVVLYISLAEVQWISVIDGGHAL